MSDSANLVPSLKETLENADKKSRSEKTSEDKDSIRLTNVDNSWNKEGILAVFDEETDTMVYCAASGVPLWYVTETGRKMQIESCGYCASNGKPYHVEHLALNENMERSSYPIEYVGAYSKEEHSKPLSPEEEAEIRKKYRL